MDEPLPGILAGSQDLTQQPPSADTTPMPGIQAGQPAEKPPVTAPPGYTPGDFLTAGKSAAIGAAKGAASLADMIFSNTIGEPIQAISGAIRRKPVSSSPVRDTADEYLPEPANKAAANIGEGATTGAVFGLPGALIGGTSAAGTEALNKVNPDHPIANAVYPAVASAVLTPGSVNQLLRFGRIMGEGANLISRAPSVQAKIDQGITSGTAASATDSDFWRKMQRSIRESLFGGNKINDAQKAEQGQLETAVGKQANTLGPDVTKQQAGTGIQAGIDDGVTKAKQLFKMREEDLDAVVDPQNTYVNMQPYINKLDTAFTMEPGAQNQVLALGQNPTATHIDPLLKDLAAISGGFQNTALPVAAIRQVKQRIGDQLTESLLNGDANARNLKIAYGELADAQGSAYAGTPYEKMYNELKAAEHEFYGSVEAFADPLVKQGVRPESIAQMLMSDMRLGDSRLSAALDLIPAGMRDQYSGMVLRNLGKTPNGEFDPNRFFNNWSRISPEAKVTLFGDANKDIPKAYDQLALIANNQARGAKAVQPSQTAGTMEVFHLFRAFGALAGGAIGAGAGYEAAKNLQGNDATVMGAGAFGGITGAGTGALLMSTIGYSGMARMMTNPAFIRWLATPVTMEQVPAHIRALSAVAGEIPDIKANADAFQEYANHLLNQSKTPFLNGGYAAFADQSSAAYAKGGPTNKSTNSPYNLFSGPISDYADGGATDYIEPPTNEQAQLDKNKDFNAWKQQYMPHDSGKDYDLWRAYQSGLTLDQSKHLPDTYKLPNHPTFSNESIYATGANANKAGSWNNDQYIKPSLLDHFLGHTSTDTIEPPPKMALGGLTDTKNPPRYPNGYLGGGSVWPTSGGLLEMCLGGSIKLAGGGAANDNPQPLRPLQQRSILDIALGGGSMVDGDQFSGFAVRSGGGAGVQWDTQPLHMWGGAPFTNSVNDNKRYAQGGISTNIHDPKPFYNPPPPVANQDIQGGGWASGGFINSSAMGYAEGGQTWEMQHNNLGGIRKAGVIATPTKGGFMSYNTQEDSLKDISRLLDVYQDKHGLNTLTGIINRWAPPNENNTKLLIQRAAKWTGINPNTPIDVHDPEIKAALIAATVMNEQGGRLPVSRELIQKVANSPSLNINIDNNSALNTKEQKPQSLLAQALPSTQEETSQPPEEDVFAPTREAINANPAFEPATKFAANKILSENG